MAAPKTVKTYDLNGTLKDFPITFEYLARKFITVTLIGTDRRELILNTDFRFSTPTQITTLRSSAWGPADNYDLIEIRRLTSATDRLVDFADGSILRAFDLNTSQIQSLHIAEEARDLTADTIGVNDEGNLDARAKRIVNVADPVDDGDAVTLRYEKAWAASTLGNKIASDLSAQASEVSRLASEAARDASVLAKTQSEASRDTTNTYKSQAQTAATNSEASSVLSGKWAENPVDVAVTTGKFSALHHATKAAASEATATTQAGIATTQAGLSATAKTASEAARDTAATYATQVQYGTVPLFMVEWWNGKRSAIPAGYIPGDGQTIARSLYTDVTTNMVTMMGPITDSAWVADPLKRGIWSQGDGSTTWRAPDLNGKSAGTIGAPFLRGDGALSAAVQGVIQGDAIRNITAQWQELYGGISPSNFAGALYAISTGVGAVGNNVASVSKTLFAGFDASRVVPTAAENRPLNVTGCWIIKVFGAVNNSGSVDANQIVTELGLQSSRISNLEATEKKVYVHAQVSTSWINPTATARVYWDVPVVVAGGITYDSTGSPNNWFVLPIGGIYKITCTFLSNAAGALVSMDVSKSGSLLMADQCYAGASVSAMTMTHVSRFVAGDKVFATLRSGALFNAAGNRYGSITIERIDN